MEVGVLGMNHRTSLLSLREDFTKACTKVLGEKKPLATLLLNTCNRIELYFSGENVVQLEKSLIEDLRPFLPPHFEQALYTYFGRECFHHLGRVISGLDSAIFGESEIQRQVKWTYERERQSKKLPFPLHYLFQKGLKIGKEIRTSLLSTHPGNDLAKVLCSIIDGKEERGTINRVLFIGNSTMNRSIMRYFLARRKERLTLCTRTIEQEEEKIPRVDWKELHYLDRYEVVISAAYHHEYIVKEEHFVEREKKSPHPALFFDLSVPRTIDPRIGTLSHLSLFNIDQIGELIEKKQKHCKEIDLCEHLLDHLIEKQVALYSRRDRQDADHASYCLPLL